jgi:hypothetical protein
VQLLVDGLDVRAIQARDQDEVVGDAQQVRDLEDPDVLALLQPGVLGGRGRELLGLDVSAPDSCSAVVLRSAWGPAPC